MDLNFSVSVFSPVRLDLSSAANFIRHLATDTYNKSSLSAIEAESYVNKLQQLEYSLATISHDMADCQNFTDRARSNGNLPISFHVSVYFFFIFPERIIKSGYFGMVDRKIPVKFDRVIMFIV